MIARKALSPILWARTSIFILGPGACAPGFMLTVRFADSLKPAPEAKRTLVQDRVDPDLLNYVLE